jgi:hypothetical protein
LDREQQTKKIKTEEGVIKKELERTKDFTNTDQAEDLLSSVLEKRNPYSKTLRIEPDGKLNKILRMDGRLVYLGFVDTPAELYQIAAEIMKKHPEYEFRFETDP